MTDREDEVAHGLVALMRSEMPHARDLQLTDLRRISEGLSRENWVLDARWTEDGASKHLPLIIRRDPDGSILQSDRPTELALLKALEKTALPTPTALWADLTGRWLDRPAMVMRREPGDCEYFVLRGNRSPEIRVGIAGALVDLLADVNTTDWRAAGVGAVLSDPGAHGATVELARWESELRRSQLEPLPELEAGLIWLRSRAPESQATVLVHGDYKPGNVLLVGNEISTLLDWELAHLGDPLEDLGWITNPFRRREHQIPGLWGAAEIVNRWSERTGYDVDQSTLKWWNVFSCFKLAAIITAGIAEFVAGRVDVIYQAPVALYRVMFDLMAEADRAGVAA
jgi:aminoglycoside phosphotransferase (APT) family kinase protein